MKETIVIWGFCSVIALLCVAIAAMTLMWGV